MREMKDSGIQWLPYIPKDWRVFRGKVILQLQKRLPDEFQEVITCFRDGEVTLRSNRRTEGFTFADKEIGYQGIKKGDLVIHGMDGFAGAIGISDSDGKGSPVLVVCDSKENKTYLMYYLRMLATQNVFIAMATGIRERSCDLRWNKVANLLFPLPSMDEQNRIVTYLDEKCAKIDAIIERQQAVIEKLKAYKQSVITEAVTRGLNPNAEMKDSGIEWIGKVPEHWKTYRVANLYEERTEPGNDELPVLMVSINTGVSDGEVSDEDRVRMVNRSEDRSKYKRVYPADLVYNMMRAWQGAFGAVRVEGLVSPAYVVAKPRRELDSRYIEALFRTESAKAEMGRYSYGIADFRLRLYWQYFKNICLCLPPIEEQREIANYIDEKSVVIDEIISRRENIINKLLQYKKSLIYEVVTGKNEV